MKINILWRNRLLQTVECQPERLKEKLETRFGLSWQQLQANGFSTQPPLVEAATASKESIIASCTEPNGSVWGVRYFNVFPPGFLVSPTSFWVWETATDEVPMFSSAQAVRGHHGCHAAWVREFNEWSTSDVDHYRTACKALVKGYGEVIVGQEGWRSSKMTIVRCIVDEKAAPQIEALKKRYAGVEFSLGRTDQNFEIVFAFPAAISKLSKWIQQKDLDNIESEFS